MVNGMLRIRKTLILISLHIKIAWLRFKTRRIELLRSEFVIYTFFILFIGLGFGMVWRANQVEPHLKAQITILEKARTELAETPYSRK